MKLVNIKSIILKDFQGNPVKVEGEELTFLDVLTNALSYETKELRIPQEQKYKNYILLLRAYDNDMVELVSEDIVRIKKGMSVLYSPMIYGQVCDLLEPKDEIKKESGK